MGRTGHLAQSLNPVLVIGISGLAVFAAGTAIALTRDDVPVARAATVLGPVRDAQVTSADGATLPAQAGQRVPNGAVVTTGTHGDAQLVTRGRIVLLSGSAADQVLDGATQQLRTGTAVVDAQQGAGLTLSVAGDTLSIPPGSATEADRGVTVRIGALAGPASITSTSGRHVVLPTLNQTVLDGDALPGSATPLHLTDSADESRVVPNLVTDDQALKILATGIDNTGQSTAAAVQAAWTGTMAAAPRGATLGEQVLPVAIADATAKAGGDAQTRYDRAVSWRADGGSWGVVVHLLAGNADGVKKALGGLLSGEPNGEVGNVATAALGGNTASVLPGAPSQAKHHHTGPPSSPPPTQPAGGTTPSPTPTPSQGLVGGLLNTVGGVLNTVIGLLPHTTATQTTGTKTTSTTAPTPKASSSSLLGGLLGGLTSK
jgi:hypothetical protein